MFGDGVVGLVFLEVGFDVSFVAFLFLRREDEGLAGHAMLGGVEGGALAAGFGGGA